MMMQIKQQLWPEQRVKNQKNRKWKRLLVRKLQMSTSNKAKRRGSKCQINLNKDVVEDA